jgi:flagellar M-ring protein FliF
MNEQVQGLLKQLSIYQRIGIVGAALASVALIGVLVMFASKPDYTPAFTGLSGSDAASVESALRGANIAYQVADAGTTIEVPVDSLGDARIAAADAGVTSANDTKGMELFDTAGFGDSAFSEQVKLQRATEGELTRTIQQMAGIASARVAIVPAQTGALSSQDTPASASVVLSMTGGATPPSSLVQAVVSTVRGSVAGIATENVVVTDTQGHVLAGAADSADTAAAQAKDVVEQQMKAKITGLIETALGSGHSSVAVSADVDTSKVEQNVTTYSPSGSNPPVSINVSNEQYGPGSSGDACGIPGANSNVPGLSSYPGVCANTTTTPSPGASASGSPSPSPSPSPSASPSVAPSGSASPTASSSAAAGYVKTTTTINYNVSQTVQHIVTAPGVVKRLSVAVFVDQTSMGSLTADTLKTSIQAAIGADATRGDVVAVNAIPFAQASAATTTAAGSKSPDMMKTVGDMSGTILGGVFALIMLVLFWLNLGALRRRAEDTALDLGPAPMSGYLPAPARGNAPAAIGAPEAAPAEMPNATPQGRIQERLRMVADERPDALVGLMHGWLREEDHRR